MPLVERLKWIERVSSGEFDPESEGAKQSPEVDGTERQQRWRVGK